MPTEKQRRQAERRRLQRQLQRRSQREAARRRRNLIASVVGTLAVIGIVVGFVVATSNDDSGSTSAAKSSAAAKSAAAARSSAAASSSPAASSSSAAAPAYPCTWKKSTQPAARKVSVPPTTRPSRKGAVTETVQTNRGTLQFRLDRTAAPCAVESFVSLAQQKYFDKTPCHRLVTQGIYVLQCGDPSGAGTGGPGYTFGDELSGKEKYTRGVLAMANSGANTNGSQFFIVYKDSTSLPPSYTVFGTVTKGLAVVDRVAAAGAATAGDGKPKLPISITKVSAG